MIVEDPRMNKTEFRPGNMLYPVPAALISCGVYEKPGDEKNCNMLTIAWTGTICSAPPMAYISVRPERFSYPILKETGEFVINLTTTQLAEITDRMGVRSGREVDKFKTSSLTPVKASVVKAPLIDESPVNIECRVTEIIPLGSHDMFLAEVVAVHVAEELLDEKGRLALEKADLIAYSHGSYFRLGEELGSFGYSVRKKGK